METTKVIYRADKKLVIFDQNKPVIILNGDNGVIKEGLCNINRKTLINKGSFFTVDAKYVKALESAIPASYFEIETFDNGCVPISLWKGVYGDSFFIKEEYRDRFVIKALKADGSVLYVEPSRLDNGGFNPYYNHLDRVINEWVEVSRHLLPKVVKTLREVKSDITLEHPKVKNLLNSFYARDIDVLQNGVIIVRGIAENLAIWGKKDMVYMTWISEDIRARISSTFPKLLSS